MRKKLLSLLLCAAMGLSLLPASALAAETKLKSVDITIELPKAGDVVEFEQKVKTTAFKGDGIDLLAKGAATVEYTDWDGDFAENENGDYVFRAGTTYYVTVQLMFDISKGYCANYRNLNGENVVDASTFKAKVNGQNATVSMSAQYFPHIQVSLTIPGERMNAEEKAEFEKNQSEEAAKLATARRATAEPYTQAEADALEHFSKATNIVVMNGSDLGRGLELGYSENYEDGYDLTYLSNFDDIGTLILDAGEDAFANRSVAQDLTTQIKNSPYLKEVWLSDKVDAYEFVKNMYHSLMRPLGNGPWYWIQSHNAFYTANATVFVSESAMASLKEKLMDCPYTPTVYTIKTYSGNDVYAAQKRGAAAAKDWCPGHKYTMELRSADRIYKYETCSQMRLWYYSCIYCGKCEYNPKHTFSQEYDLAKKVLESNGHSEIYDRLATDDAYVGVNAAGEYVYWLSCENCGKSYRNFQSRLNAADLELSGSEASLEQFRQAALDALKMQETMALSSTECGAGMFTLLKRNTAKVSTWAQSDVNFALNDDLLDTSLLGNDYTRPISRLQFCSVAVRLAEEMTGKTITPASSGTFKDTSNTYVLKAYAAGITSGTSDTTFSPSGTLTRQQMATFLYRTLMYIEKNSDYAYTSYTSRLANYKDSSQIQSWAREAMAFMNALDIINGTTDTTLSPNGTCTIEQAVAVAERSVYAHQIGWYQGADDAEDINYATAPAAGTTVNTSLNPGDRVWVTGKRMGTYLDVDSVSGNVDSTWLPAINPYSGQLEYLSARKLRPIRG